jgi:uncharacterized protein YdeI (YjbR/CyaY-like superfamily)
VSQKPVFFAKAKTLGRWFTKHAASAPELVVGFMKKSTGVASVTWPEAVDEALCVGWIDGVRHRIDDERYQIRFTPRRPGSHWSKTKTGRASYEQNAPVKLSPRVISVFKRNAAAWKYYGTLPPGYKKMVNWWVMSARKDETRMRRLATLVSACAQKRRLDWGAKLI